MLGRMEMRENKELSIIIVNYNNYSLTISCVESVIKNTLNVNYEIIIIDNCSTNNSYEIIKKSFEEFSNIIVERNKFNAGFGDGNNKAVELASSDVLLFLNPDVIVFDNSIKILLDEVRNNHNIGIIGAQLLNTDKSLQYSCRRILNMKEFLIARTPMKKVCSKKYICNINDKYLMKDLPHDNNIEADWLMGSCLMMKKSMFSEVGGFSKEYFMYFEDVDICYKVKKRGKKILYFPLAKMIHAHEQASVKKINRMTFIHLSSMFKFYKKYNSKEELI